MVESGQEVRPRASDLFEFGGEILGRERAGGERGGEERFGRLQRFVADDGGGTAGGFRGGLAQFELQAPALLADFRIGPDFEGADFGELGAELDGDEALALFAEADDGVERGVEMEFVAEGFGREIERVAEFVFGAAERAVEAEGDGLVGDELQVLVIDFERGAVFGAARDEADGAEFAIGFAGADEVGAGKAAANEQAGCRWSGRRNSRPRRRRRRGRDPGSRG